MKDLKEYSTEEIISAIRSKENINMALNYLYKSHYKYLEKYVLQNSGNEDDAADIIQEGFLVFIKMAEENKYRQEASIKSYLYSIVKNLWISELRKRKSMSIRNEIFTNNKEETEVDISVALIKHESYQLVMDTFSELGEKCKQILYWFYYENLSMKEMMELDNFSNEQVLRNKKHKCLKRLIEKIHSDPSKYETIKNALRYAG
ncbi:sigma-70 family RNA polymerase sigma factor [Cecembia sp.]|uniref:RNA polymerase sigma factor n=1 Tax=Cecembia sp. TaxID=1898110 RepID=UPI0025BE66A5|nr:sigma-70 family RNA polymerase sigma factor [Cecembia sp.]